MLPFYVGENQPLGNQSTYQLINIRCQLFSGSNAIKRVVPWYFKEVILRFQVGYCEYNDMEVFFKFIKIQ